MPPDLTLLARVLLELRFQHTIEDHAWQGVAGLACHEIRTGGRSPDSKELFRGNLVGDVPVGGATPGSGAQHLVGNLHLVLELDALPVLGELGVTALNRERRVVILAVGSEESAEHRFIPLFPGSLVATHELLDIHRAPQV